MRRQYRRHNVRRHMLICTFASTYRINRVYFTDTARCLVGGVASQLVIGIASRKVRSSRKHSFHVCYSQPGQMLINISDDLDQGDPPETPAPVFAARAISRAIFGTPAEARYNEDEDDDYDMKMESKPAPKLSGVPPINLEVKENSRGILSPTKPTGILMTPGTAATRRKTVSFGTGFEDNGEKVRASKSGIPDDCPGKFPSPWAGKDDIASASRRRTALTRSLEKARQSRPKKSMLDAEKKEPVSIVEDADSEETGTEDDKKKKRQRAKKGHVKPYAANSEAFEKDMTIDLNEPQSQSGQFWKTHHEHYHEEAIREMTKLVHYREAAKSYAKLKDDEATELAAKLREEQEKVAKMEEANSKIIAAIASRRRLGADEEDPELMETLARQMAFAGQYRTEVDQFRNALEENGKSSERIDEERGRTTLSTADMNTLIETSRELKKAREQVRDMDAMREEIKSMKAKLSTAEDKIRSLSQDNKTLTRKLGAASKKSATPGTAEAPNDDLQSLQDELATLSKEHETIKEQAKSQRREAERLLQKRHDQVAKLKQDNACMKGDLRNEVEKIQQLASKRDKDRNREMEGYKRELARLKDEKSEKGVDANEPLKSSRGTSKAPVATPRPEAATGEVLERKIDRQGDQIIQPDANQKSHLPNKSAESHQHSAFRPRDKVVRSPISYAVPMGESHSALPPIHPTALTDITNGASKENSRSATVSRDEGPTKVSSENVNRRYSAAIHDVSYDAVPLPEPSPTFKRHNKSLSADSPRPSMFTITSSPPTRPPPHLLQQLVNDKRSSGMPGSNPERTVSASNRLSSLASSRPRGALAPERAAAAKARLAQKNAEKKARQMGEEHKENVRV